uniref:Uncharacterized protein n=1 Tax=Strigamia maritima TaxID=126957 RepID=T1IVS2_STRMM
MSHAADHKLTMELSSSGLTKSEYDKVIFHEIAESYSTDADVECRYTLTPTIIPTKGDRVALFKIGWEDTHQYVTHSWVSPINEKERTAELTILFKAQDLPKDDGEFYQFCYITAEGYVRGASIPFRFRRPTNDELVEVQDNDSDLLIIRTRTAVIEERLRDVAFKNSCLLKEKCGLEHELRARENVCATLEMKLKDFEVELERSRDEKKKTSCIIQERQDLMLQMREAKSTNARQNADLKKTLVQNEAYIKELRDTVKVLTEQKDELSKKWTNEIQESNNLKKQHNESEIRLKAFMVKSEQLGKELSIQREIATRLQQQIKSLETSLRDEQKKSLDLKDKLITTELDAKQAIAQLADTEHMLAAMEKSKQLAAEELMAFGDFKTNMLNELERKQTEHKSIISRFKLLEAEHKEMLTGNVKKEKVVEKEFQELSEKYLSLKESSEKALRSEQKRSAEYELNLRALIDDLTLRLKTGASEYQKKYIECLKLEKKLGKLRRKYKTIQEKLQLNIKEEKIKNEVMNVADESDADEPESDAHNKIKFDFLTEIVDQKDFLISQLNTEIKKLKKQLEQSDHKVDNKLLATPVKLTNDCKNVHLESSSYNSDDKNIPNNGPQQSHPARVQSFSTISPYPFPTINPSLSASSSNPSLNETNNAIPKPIPNTDIPYYPYPYPVYPFPTNPFLSQPDTAAPKLVSSSALPDRHLSHITDVNVMDHDGVKCEAKKILPAPMKPEMTAKARVAAIAAMTRRMIEGPLVELDQLRRPRETNNTRHVLTIDLRSREDLTAGADEVICPMCHLVYYPPYDIRDLEKHINTHFALECPMCSKTYDSQDQAQYERHVQAHFSEDKK